MRWLPRWWYHGEGAFPVKRGRGRPVFGESETYRANTQVCINGHALTPENTDVRPKYQTRVCLTCKKDAIRSSSVQRIRVPNDVYDVACEIARRNDTSVNRVLTLALIQQLRRP